MKWASEFLVDVLMKINSHAIESKRLEGQGDEDTSAYKRHQGWICALKDGSDLLVAPNVTYSASAETLLEICDEEISKYRRVRFQQESKKHTDSKFIAWINGNELAWKWMRKELEQ